MEEEKLFFITLMIPALLLLKILLKNMNNLLLAPHNDDEALFASYIILRWKPKVLIITDSHIHEAKFGESRGIVARRKESEEAMKILGVEVDFLGIPDNGLYLDNLIVNLEDYGNPDGKIFAPAKQGGHKDHDTVSEAATRSEEHTSE